MSVDGTPTPDCDDYSYNDMATALFVNRQQVIISMMEDPSRFSPATLLGCGSCFFVLMTLTYGASIPAGVFVPTILIGSCFGSLFGLGLQEIFAWWVQQHDCPPGSWCFELEISAAPYTLQGAVALLGGIQRSSLSLVVIILEGTGAIKQLLPIILTTVPSPEHTYFYLHSILTEITVLILNLSTFVMEQVVSKWVGDTFNNGL
jgi:chloride channel 7